MADNNDRYIYDYSSSDFDRDAALAHIFSTDAFADLPAKQGLHLTWSKTKADDIAELMAHSHERRRAFNDANAQKSKTLQKYLFQVKVFAPLFFATIIVSHLGPMAGIKWPLLIGSAPVFMIYLVYPIIRMCLTALNDDPNAITYQEEIQNTERDIIRLYAYVEATNIHARNFDEQDYNPPHKKHLN